MKKWLKILLIVLGAIILLVAIALVIASPIAKGYVNSHGKELLGRDVHIEKLRVNALTGRVVICDLTIKEEDGKSDFLGFDTLDVSVKLRKLLASELYVRHIILSGLNVNVMQDGDRFNFTSIIDFFASDEEEEEDTTSSDWKLGFYNIRISNGAVYYADLQRGSEWDLKNLNIKVPGVYFDGSEDTDAGLALQLANGGVLRTEAKMNMDNNDFAVDLDLEDFAISNVRAYLTDIIDVGVLEGLLNASINVKGNLSEIMKMNIGGWLNIDGIDVRDSKDNPVVACNAIKVKLNRVSLDENLFDIDSVAIVAPVTHFDVFADGSNFSKLFVSSESTEAETAETEVPSEAEAEEPSSPMKLHVGSFVIRDAEFTYNDYTLPDQFSFPIKRLNVSVDNFMLDGENNAKVFAQLPHGGMAMIKWKGDISNWKRRQNLVLNIKNLKLADLSPYSVAYLGYPFTDGTFSFVSENNVVNGKLDGHNKLDLYKPEVGKKCSDVEAEINIPLKAALYVLKDKDGKVEFSVPVAGDIDSPEFSYMKIVWKTLGNLLVKVATSPLRAVAGAIGGGNDGLDFVGFDPLSFDFTSEQHESLGRIAELMQYDSSIVVTLTPHINMASATTEQSLFNLKKDYYFTIHTEKATTGRLEMSDYDAIKLISVKDAGFQAYLAGGSEGKRLSEKEVARMASERYSADQCQQQLLALMESRNRYITRYFSEQMHLSASQLEIAPAVLDATNNGYAVTSELREETNEK